MPQEVDTSSKLTQKKVVDSGFLPDWMYHYPEYIRNEQLQIDFVTEFRQIESFGPLKTALDKYKTIEGFSGRIPTELPFMPHVADSGTKRSTELEGAFVRRRMYIAYYRSAEAFYKRLIQPRGFDQAKKRLIELASHDQETALICWLTLPPHEKPYFQEFLRRHATSESFLGERVDWKGNIWETEFHLGFHQLLSEYDNIHHLNSLDHQDQLRRIMKMPSLSKISDQREIRPVTMSFRFVGDLRDRSWTCHYFSSVARVNGFTGLVDEYTYSRSNDEDFYTEVIGQRKILEMTYIEKMLIEMGQSSDGIFNAFQNELNVPETRDPQNESYEFIHNYSRLHSRAGEILRDVLHHFDSAVRAVEEWERREEIRPVRSRWSQKDERRYGPKVIALTYRCKRSIQQLRMQRNRLQEQQKLAERRHSNLITYMQLQNARTSSQSAEDVRLFTYVTIIFLPLTFSSSLFSMAGAPQGSTISVMVPTTVIALAITILVLSNMKVLDRNWKFQVYKFNAKARRKMEATEHPWGFHWKKISKELEKATEFRLAKPDNERQSKWWYFLFWSSYILKLPRLYVLESVDIWDLRHNQRVKHNYITFKILLSLALVPA
ncbi:MAG: hypothetical protein Q9225_003767, partial [Loekoesia sp. 1 TL-2023]